jgi:hypothetical protein
MISARTHKGDDPPKKRDTKGMKRTEMRGSGDLESGPTISDATDCFGVHESQKTRRNQESKKGKVVNPLEKPKTQSPVNFPPNYCNSRVEHHKIKSF